MTVNMRLEKDPHTYEFYCRGCSFGMGLSLCFFYCMKRVLNEALAKNESNARSPGRNLSKMWQRSEEAMAVI